MPRQRGSGNRKMRPGFLPQRFFGSVIATIFLIGLIVVVALLMPIF
jgi:hypothetical protein